MKGISRLMGGGAALFSAWAWAGDAYVTRSLATARGPVAVSVTDLDSDGRADVIVATMGDSHVKAYVGESTPVVLQTAEGPSFFLAKDLDADGVTDLAVACFFGDRVQLFASRGRQLKAEAEIKARQGPIAFDVADFDGDGRLDMATSNLSSGEITVFLQVKALKFRRLTTLPCDRVTAVVARDFNGDGLSDIAALASQSAAVILFAGKGDGSFSAPRGFAVGDNPVSIAISDLNADKLPDMIVACNSVDGGTLLLSRAAAPGTFEDGKSLFLPSGSNSVVAADLDGDRRVDLAFTQPSQNRIAVLRAGPDASFSPPELYAVGRNPTALAAGDVNGDGKTDLVVANFSDATVSILTAR